MTEVVNWIWEAPTLEERLQRIEEFLLSKQKYLHPELGIHVPLRVIVKRSRQGRWYIDTFHPRYRR
jgi:uncharacterized protein (DUF302 family)